MPNLPLIGRLAPSPTGAQHVGNARTYLLAWLAVRSRGGRVILRIEDIDSPRVKRGADQQAIDDLHWLGLDWDEGPDVGGPHAPYVQTQRVALYENALQQLQAAEQVYPCTCTRSDVAAAASAPHVGQEGPRYPGTCAGNRAADAAKFADRPFAWRFRTSSLRREFVDLVAGPQACNVAEELGDFVVYKSTPNWKGESSPLNWNGEPALPSSSNGSAGASPSQIHTPSYQLAVVVDDHAMGVTQVLRGDDLLPSAFRQLELYDFFGWQPPQFAHVPLVVGHDGRRLAKRHGDTRLATLRAQGIKPEQLIGLLAYSCRLRNAPSPCTASELLPDFDLQSLPREPWVFREEMLRI